MDPSVLRNFQELKHVSDHDLQQMYKQLRPLSYREGTMICREGDDSNSCFLLLDGIVQVSKDLPDGRRLLLTNLCPYTLIGPSGLIAGQARTANVKSVTKVELLSLQREPYVWALQNKMPWAISLLEVISVNLVRKVRGALDQLHKLATDDQYETVIEGASRTEPKKVPTYMNMTGFQAPPGGKPPAPSAPAQPQAPNIPNTTTEQLLNLLKATNHSFDTEDISLKDVHFVDPDDMKN
jgi:CRP-like cAMP-binding protein